MEFSDVEKSLSKLVHLEYASMEEYKKTLLREVRAVLGCDIVSLWWLQDDQHVIECEFYLAQDSDEFVAGERVDLADYPRYLKHLRKGLMISAPDPRSHEATSEFTDRLDGHNIQSSLISPVRLDDHFSGVLVCESVTARRDWSSLEQQYLFSVVSLLIQGWLLDKRLAAERSAARSLKMLEQRSTIALKAASAGFWLWDKTADSLSGRGLDSKLEPFELQGVESSVLDWSKNVHPDDWPQLREAMLAAKKDGAAVDLQFRTVEDGETRWIRLVGEPILSAEGELTGMTGLRIDITPQKEVEEQLRLREAYLQGALDNSPSGVVVMDGRGTIKLVNQGIAELSGYSIEQLTGQNIKMLMPPRHAKGHDGYLKKYHETGQKHLIGTTREMELQRKDGLVIPVSLQVGEFSTPSGEAQFIGSIQDLRERYSLEKQLRRSQRLDAMGRFTGGIAHDFNNMLAIMIGNLDLLEMADLSSPQRESLQLCMEAALKGAAMTRRLLQFSRRGEVEAAADIDANEVVEDVLQMAAKPIIAGLTVRRDLADDLWRCQMDTGELEDILLNLLMNAAEAMNGRGEISVKSENRKYSAGDLMGRASLSDGDYVMISVTDNGCGIPADAIDRIFDPFFSTKPDDKGTGLGLATAYNTLKRRSGNISVYSEEGLGSTFRIYLPRALGETTHKESEREPSQADAGNEKIMVVDDEKEIRQTVAAMLESLGYDVRVAADGGEAEELYRDFKPQVLLTDIVMPGPFDGVELAERMVELDPDIKVLLMTGYAGSTSRLQESASGEGTFQLIQKPFRKHRIARRLRNILDNRPTEG